MNQSCDEGPARILVVDDETANREFLEAALHEAGYEVVLARGGEEGLELAHDKRPDLILLDLMMPGLSGFEVCARVKTDPQTGGIPILFVTALDETGHKERALAAGGDDFLTKPFERSELLAHVHALLKVRHLNRDLDRALAYLHEIELARYANQPERAPGPPSGSPPCAGIVLVVDDAPFVRRVYGEVLQEAGYVTHLAASGQEGLDLALREAIDVILLDIMMPEMSGLEVLAKLGERLPDSPVIIVTANPTSENAIAALRLGAFDFIVKGFKNELLLATVARAMERRRLVIRDRALINQLEAKMHELLAELAKHAQHTTSPDRPAPRG